MTESSPFFAGCIISMIASRIVLAAVTGPSDPSGQGGLDAIAHLLPIFYTLPAFMLTHVAVYNFLRDKRRRTEGCSACVAIGLGVAMHIIGVLVKWHSDTVAALAK